LEDLVSGTLGHTRKGVPQGAPHSPLIAMVGKTVYSGKYPWEKEILQNHIEYVDDGITDKEVKSNPESGTIIQPLKSG
jgi:retron-type reverse transcriptase